MGANFSSCNCQNISPDDRRARQAQRQAVWAAWREEKVARDAAHAGVWGADREMSPTGDFHQEFEGRMNHMGRRGRGGRARACGRQRLAWAIIRQEQAERLLEAKRQAHLSPADTFTHYAPAFQSVRSVEDVPGFPLPETNGDFVRQGYPHQFIVEQTSVDPWARAESSNSVFSSSHMPTPMPAPMDDLPENGPPSYDSVWES